MENYRKHCQIYSPESPPPANGMIEKYPISTEVFQIEFESRYNQLEESKKEQDKLRKKLGKVNDAIEVNKKRIRRKKNNRK